MEFSSIAIEEVNSHIIINDEQNVLIDTGSPLSFHQSGQIVLGNETFNVPSSVLGVTSEYLSQKVGKEINGLVGMDILNKNPIMISLKDKMMFINDDAHYEKILRQVGELSRSGGLMGIEMLINGQLARMIVDTGAKISYVKGPFVEGLESKGEADDFLPYIGDFKTSLYPCTTTLLFETNHEEVSYKQDFGEMPPTISKIVSTLNMDGIIGYEFFKKFRLQINKGDIFFPPQGI